MEIQSILISEKKMVKSFPHMHEEWELIYNIEGSGEYIIDGQSYVFKPGTVLLCPPYTYHDKKAQCGTFQDLYVDFTDSNLVSGMGLTFFEDDMSENLKALFHMAYKIFTQKEEGYMHLSARIIELILSFIITKKDSKIYSGATAELKNIIVDNFSNPEFKCIKAIENMAYNNDYVRRCFKKDMGMTPTEYLCKIRLNYAASLLRVKTSPLLSVTDIAFNSGFYDARYFARKFFQEFKMSATEYRKEK